SFVIHPSPFLARGSKRPFPQPRVISRPLDREGEGKDRRPSGVVKRLGGGREHGGFSARSPRGEGVGRFCLSSPPSGQVDATLHHLTGSYEHAQARPPRSSPPPTRRRSRSTHKPSTGKAAPRACATCPQARPPGPPAKARRSRGQDRRSFPG